MATKSFDAPRTVPQMALPGFGAEVHGDRHRLFFALVPDDSVRQELFRVAGFLKAQLHPRGSWIAPERYHLTLHFLGDNSELRQDLVDRASTAATKVRMPAFDLVLDHAASFRGPAPPWVLRCPEPAESIQQLWRALGIALVGERMRSESGSGFTPHVTVLRDADKPLAPCAIGTVVWPVRDFVLIHSQLGRERRYTELGRWPLTPATKPGA
jgi:2'-5' RNA ligase